MKLTKAQAAALKSEIIRTFDVWGGYSWETEEGDRISTATANALLKRGLIKEGRTVRPYSGYHETYYPTTEAGLSALAEQEKANA